MPGAKQSTAVTGGDPANSYIDIALRQWLVEDMMNTFKHPQGKCEKYIVKHFHVCIILIKNCREKLKYMLAQQFSEEV